MELRQEGVDDDHVVHGVSRSEARRPLIQQGVGEILDHQLILVNGGNDMFGESVRSPVARDSVYGLCR